MKSAVIVFPDSNGDRDVAVALKAVSGHEAHMAWHADTELPQVDLIVLPGGFSYGDYLRAGAMAANASIMREVVRRAEAGVHVLGICNGFQVLTEARLLPGALMRNEKLKFISRMMSLEVVADDTPFTKNNHKGEIVQFPIAHADGNYQADAETLASLEGNGQIVFRYAGGAPNGAALDIAGIRNSKGNVLGLMPHPERAIDKIHGSSDGLVFFKSAVEALG